MLLHGAVLAVLATFAVSRFEGPKPDDATDVDIIDLDDEPLTEDLEPDPEPVDPPPVPTEMRPEVVPKTVKITQVDKPKPFQEDPIPGDREAPSDAEAIPTPTAPLTFAMESDVGGGNADFESTTVGGSDTQIAAPGPAVGKPSAVGNQDAVGIKVAKDWQVTSLPEPTNDRRFEPDYPPLAKREGREARIRVELQIDSAGKVAHAKVLAGEAGHGFRKAALAYVRKLRFKPARAGDNPVAARIEWTVYFYARN